jgi:tyrosine-protein phosphatase non-receptor type 9
MCVQGVVYQLDVALQSLETQRAGLVFIYDMTDSKYTNFDYELSQKILTLLKVIFTFISVTAIQWTS